MSRPCYTNWSRKIVEKTVNFVENNHCRTRDDFAYFGSRSKKVGPVATKHLKIAKKNGIM